MLYKHAMLLPAAAFAMTVATAVPSMADCDTAKLAEVVKASGVTETGPAGAIAVVNAYAKNACAVGRQDIAMVRGMTSDAYPEVGSAAIDASKALAANVGMGCDMDPEPLLVLDACSLEDVEKALGGM
jgi:hypothetical protein